MSCIYGQRQFGFEDQGWIAHFIISAICGKPITIFGDGKQVRDILYVSDLVRAFDHFIDSDVNSGVFNLGGGALNSLSLLELLNILEQHLEKKIPVSFGPWRPSDQKVYISDISKLKKTIGWTPIVSVPEGINKLIRWAIDHKRIF
jgi:CDP-paratose 2-epimerase